VRQAFTSGRRETLLATVDPDLAKVAAMSVRDEYTDYSTYLALSRRERNPSFKKALEELAQEERDHYEFWKKYAPDTRVSTNRLSLFFVLVLRIILGLTFTMKFLERHEEDVISRYKQVAGSILIEDRTRFDAMVNDEEHHENYLMGEVKEGRVKYMSFIVLGLADAVVDLGNPRRLTRNIQSHRDCRREWNRRRHGCVDRYGFRGLCSGQTRLRRLGQMVGNLHGRVLHAYSGIASATILLDSCHGRSPRDVSNHRGDTGCNDDVLRHGDLES